MKIALAGMFFTLGVLMFARGHDLSGSIIWGASALFAISSMVERRTGRR